MCIVMEGRKLGDCDLILNNSPVLLPTPCSPWLAIASLELSKATGILQIQPSGSPFFYLRALCCISELLLHFDCST